MDSPGNGFTAFKWHVIFLWLVDMDTLKKKYNIFKMVSETNSTLK